MDNLVDCTLVLEQFIDCGFESSNLLIKSWCRGFTRLESISRTSWSYFIWYSCFPNPFFSEFYEPNCQHKIGYNHMLFISRLNPKPASLAKLKLLKSHNYAVVRYYDHFSESQHEQQSLTASNGTRSNSKIRELDKHFSNQAICIESSFSIHYYLFIAQPTP